MTDHRPTCATCWAAYEPTTEGIRRRQTLQGHRPSPRSWPVGGPLVDAVTRATKTTGRTK